MDNRPKKEVVINSISGNYSSPLLTASARWEPASMKSSAARLVTASAALCASSITTLPTMMAVSISSPLAL